MKFISFFTVLFLAGNLSAQQTYVPDDNFENYLETHDANGNQVPVGDPNSMGNGIANDDYVTTAKINTVTSLTPIGRHIVDMTGVEDFTALTHLECQYNQISSLDVSQNIALTHFECYYNQLSGLDMSQNIALTYLDCTTNQLNYLNLGQNTNLTVIRCADNELTSIDVTQLPNLNTLACAGNQLASLDISQNMALTILGCSNNQLTDLDTSHNPNLEYLYCEDNQITSLDITSNPMILRLDCVGNNLTKLDMRNGNNTAITNFYARINPDLVCIDVDDPTYMNTHWANAIDATASYNTHCETYVPDDNFEDFLEYMGMGNGVANDDYVSTTSIKTVTNLFIPNQNISDLTGIEDFTELTSLDCSENNLSSLDITHNIYLTNLDCSLNHLNELDVTQNSYLQFLYCASNNLSSLDVTHNADLLILSCNTNQISSLDVTLNPLLTELKCYNNQLTGLDVSHNPDLAYFYCGSNQLSSLDVSHNPDLYYFRCAYNQLSNLDLTQNTVLRSLDCTYNNLTSLNISQNTALEQIYCYNNQLSDLDLTQNTSLTDFDCSYNQLNTFDIRNGNNIAINYFKSSHNPDLTCIFVDDVAYSSSNWILIDPSSHFVATQAECDELNIDENQLNESVKLYPNPANQTLIISNDHNLDINQVSIYNMLGMLVYKADYLPNRIDTSHLKAGMYLVKIDSDEVPATQKLIIRH